MDLLYKDSKSYSACCIFVYILIYFRWIQKLLYKLPKVAAFFV